MPLISRPLPPAAALLLAACALCAGCTSDDPSGVGRDLVGVGVDSVLVPLTLWEPDHAGALEVTDGDRPLDEYETLYLGSDGGDASSILVTFDFATLPDAVWTAEYLRPENVVGARLRLQMLTWYFPNHGATLPDTLVLPNRFWTGARKRYDVHVLGAEFDTLSHPGPEPAFAPAHVNQPAVVEEFADGPVFVELAPEVVAGWLTSGRRLSLIIREGSGSQPGLLGFASKEMAHGGSTLPINYAANSVGPTLLVSVQDLPPEVPSGAELAVKPVADVSTWHAVEATPGDAAGGLLFRTHLRSYPALGFDLDALPPDVRVNRARLTLVSDTTRTVGPAHVLVASEVAPEVAPPGVTSVLLADLAPAMTVAGGRSGLNPEDPASDVVTIDVTSSLQRFLNHAYEGRRVFLLTEGERFLSGWRTNPAPDFWYRRRAFHGTADPDSSLRPRLQILYSREDVVSGSGGS